MDEQSVTFQGTEAGDKPLITIMYAGMPEGMAKVLEEHAWSIIAKFYMLQAEDNRKRGAR